MKNIILFILCIIFYCGSILSQESENYSTSKSWRQEGIKTPQKILPYETSSTIINTDCKDTGYVYRWTNVDERVSYPGGSDTLAKFLKENVRYPKNASDRGIEGRVFLTGIVNVDGTVCDIKVTRSADPYLDAEAVRVYSIMKWNPAKKDGEKVRCHHDIPLIFQRLK